MPPAFTHFFGLYAAPTALWVVGPKRRNSAPRFGDQDVVGGPKQRDHRTHGIASAGAVGARCRRRSRHRAAPYVGGGGCTLATRGGSYMNSSEAPVGAFPLSPSMDLRERKVYRGPSAGAAARVLPSRHRGDLPLSGPACARAGRELERRSCAGRALPPRCRSVSATAAPTGRSQSRDYADAEAAAALTEEQVFFR